MYYDVRFNGPFLSNAVYIHFHQTDGIFVRESDHIGLLFLTYISKKYYIKDCC